jgi:hypothetical protein
LTLFSIEFQELKMASGVRKVVKSTRNKLMPSIPTWYWIPKLGTQGTDCSNCIRELNKSKLKKSGTEAPKVRMETARAQFRMPLVFSFLTANRGRAPTRGKNVMMVRMGWVEGEPTI